MWGYDWKDWKERKKDEDMKRLKDNYWKEREMKDNDWKERKKDVKTWKDWKIMIGKKERKMWGHEKTER